MNTKLLLDLFQKLPFGWGKFCWNYIQPYKHQVAALNIWETSWPACIDVLLYISLPLLHGFIALTWLLTPRCTDLSRTSHWLVIAGESNPFPCLKLQQVMGPVYISSATRWQIHQLEKSAMWSNSMARIFHSGSLDVGSNLNNTTPLTLWMEQKSFQKR